MEIFISTETLLYKLLYFLGKAFNKPLKDCFQGRRLNLTLNLNSFKSFLQSFFYFVGSFIMHQNFSAATDYAPKTSVLLQIMHQNFSAATDYAPKLQCCCRLCTKTSVLLQIMHQNFSAAADYAPKLQCCCRLCTKTSVLLQIMHQNFSADTDWHIETKVLVKNI